jgi:AcrR family transcriptional regulator
VQIISTGATVVKSMSAPADPRPTRRQRQAQGTRTDILGAARRLFAERGYAHVSMTDIAREADVAVQTIYASVGSKRALVLALVDLIDEQSDVPVLAARIGAAPSAHEALAAGVHLTRHMQERVGDLIAVLLSAGSVDEDAAAAAEVGLARHRDGAARVAARIEALGGLREGVTVAEAAAAISVLTSSATYKQLRREFGWSLDDCERWMVAVLGERLLARGP